MKKILICLLVMLCCFGCTPSTNDDQSNVTARNIIYNSELSTEETEQLLNAIDTTKYKPYHYMNEETFYGDIPYLNLEVTKDGRKTNIAIDNTFGLLLYEGVWYAVDIDDKLFDISRRICASHNWTTYLEFTQEQLSAPFKLYGGTIVDEQYYFGGYLLSGDTGIAEALKAVGLTGAGNETIEDIFCSQLKLKGVSLNNLNSVVKYGGLKIKYIADSLVPVTTDEGDIFIKKMNVFLIKKDS